MMLCIYTSDNYMLAAVGAPHLTHDFMNTYLPDIHYKEQGQSLEMLLQYSERVSSSAQ